MGAATHAARAWLLRPATHAAGWRTPAAVGLWVSVVRWQRRRHAGLRRARAFAHSCSDARASAGAGGVSRCAPVRLPKRRWGVQECRGRAIAPRGVEQRRAPALKPLNGAWPLPATPVAFGRLSKPQSACSRCPHAGSERSDRHSARMRLVAMARPRGGAWISARRRGGAEAPGRMRL